ncbi:MAG: DNA alkylation repair protein [Chloroflexota bacterium]
MTSEVSRRAAALVEARLPDAHALGERLADLIGEPEAFVAELRSGLAALADDAYAAAQEHVAPGSGATIGTRWPLIHEVERALVGPFRESSSAWVLSLAMRLAVEPEREVRLFALPCLRRTLPGDPERSWQLLRRLARGANDWIEVDSLAHPYAQGVLAERFRWAELEQLVYSDRRMERRLVGSTLATLPHEVPTAHRRHLDPGPALQLLAQLIGDADDQVQKALSWALREWARVDRDAVGEWLAAQSVVAAAADDGHRAWVIRDALAPHPPEVAAPIRARLAGIRRRADAPSTSRASDIAATYGLAAMADRAVAQQGERFTGRGA